MIYECIRTHYVSNMRSEELLFCGIRLHIRLWQTHRVLERRLQQSLNVSSVQCQDPSHPTLGVKIEDPSHKCTTLRRLQS